MCLRSNNSLRGNCKCKFADSCKRHIEFERVHNPKSTPDNRRDKACLVSTARPMDTATTIDFIPNKIYPPSNFVGCS
jgi:hypothetical protein